MSLRIRRPAVPLIAAALLLAAGAIIFRGVLARRVLWERGLETPQEQPVETRPVTLYFGSPDGNGVAAERREAPMSGDLTETVRTVILQLIAGPSGPLVPVFPDETEVRDVFAGADGVLYLNFGPGLIERHPGGSCAEYATLASLVRTMTENFSDVKAVQILVDGRPRETLAGHYGMRDPLRPEDFE
jgi:spore germination protein GerM